MSDEVCVRCKDKDNYRATHDLRTLLMACMYEMSEMKDVPFEQARDGERGRIFYTLTVCKDCRGDWMKAIQQWFHAKPSNQIESPGTGYLVRELGANVEKPLPDGRGKIRV